MELRRRIDARTIFVIVAWLVMAVYLWIGLQPAEATQYVVSGQVEIPSLGMVSDVTEVEPEGRELGTPDLIVGSFSEHTNKTLLFGHSTSAFQGLDALGLRETIIYNDKTYRVIERKIIRKASISMNEVLKEEERDTIVLMTCAGTLLGGGDATHRLIITAVATE